MLKKEMCYMSAKNPSTKNISGTYIFFVKRVTIYSNISSFPALALKLISLL